MIINIFSIQKTIKNMIKKRLLTLNNNHFSGNAKYYYAYIK